MPRLQVHGEAPIAPPALIHIARRVIEDAEHRHKTVARAIRATNPRATRANIGAVQANATRIFADVRAIIQRLEDAGDTVVVHGHEETGGALLPGSAGTVESGRGVGELLGAEQVIGAEGLRQIRAPEGEGHAHPEVLGALAND